MVLWRRWRPRGVVAPLDRQRVPKHVAIIMDGNGRWASRRGLVRSMGHRAGLNRLEEVVRAGIDWGVEYLTFYAFSTENWRRSPEEINYLMDLFRRTLAEKTETMHRDKVRIRFIGRRDRLPPDLVSMMETAERKTADNKGITLVLAIDYGSRDEITAAARILIHEARAGKVDPESLTERDLAARLYTSDLPDPDLVIRPSGEYRLSNFLLWQSAYAELYFTPVLWPDFEAKQFLAALHDYARRERRYGRA